MKDPEVVRRAALAYELADGWKRGTPKGPVCDDIISEHVDFLEDPQRWHQLITAACVMAEQRLLEKVEPQLCKRCITHMTSKDGCATRSEYAKRKLCDECYDIKKMCEYCGGSLRSGSRRDIRKRFCDRKCYNKWYKTQPDKNVYRPGRGAFAYGY